MVDAMNPFLAAQARDPFDPSPMLIHADWLEERGDLTAANALRGLVAAGIPSLVELALDSTLVSGPWRPDGSGQPDEVGRMGIWRSGFGCGDGDEFDDAHGEGVGLRDALELNPRPGSGYGDGDGGVSANEGGARLAAR